MMNLFYITSIWLFTCVLVELLLFPFIGFYVFITTLMILSNLIIRTISNSKIISYILYLIPLFMLLVCYAKVDDVSIYLGWSLVKWVPCVLFADFQRNETLFVKSDIFFYAIALIPFFIIIYHPIID